MIHSKKFTINLKDVIHGFVTAFLTASSVGLMTMLESGTFPTSGDIKSQLLIGLAGGVAYLVKKFLSTSDNKILGKEADNKIQ